MTMFRERKSWVVLVAVLLLFAACKGETPTAPPPGGGGPPGGGTTPPSTGVTITLATSNANPVVDSTVTITATVTQGGQPVPNGTAVEFNATGGTLNGGGTSTVKTTTNGVAAVTLTSGTVGTVRVTATVGSVSRETSVAFQARPVTPQPPNTAPTITSVSPNIGRPTGGETIRITGTNFRPPVRVLFRFAGQANPVEAFVVSSTETSIEVITPSVNLGAGQQIVADIIVLTQAGTANENRAEASGAFTFRNERLTPAISTISPSSGPVTGGTRVTIFGEGFQEPVQVQFGFSEAPSWHDARVLNVTFNEIIVESPNASQTNPGGSGPLTGPVDVRVVNIKSNTSAFADNVFRFISAVVITAVGPTEGPFTGGTRVEIDGQGFVSPVAVTIGGIAAQPIFVSGTKIIAITSALDVATCADAPGAVSVTNVVNGDTAQGPIFTFRVPRPVIVAATTEIAPGGTIDIVVANAIGVPRLRLGTTNLPIVGTTVNPDGTTTFRATVPTTLRFNTEACPAVPGAARIVETPLDITYESATTGCTTTFAGGTVLTPPENTPIITFAPPAFTTFTAPITPATPDPDGPGPQTGTPASVTPSPAQTVTLTNTGTGTLTVTAVTPGAGCTNFTIANPTPPVSLGPCDPFPITAVYRGQTTATTETCTLTVTTSAGTRTLTLTGRSQ